MLTPIGEPLPQERQDRGSHILETLQGLGVEHQLHLACRTRLAVHEQLAKAAVRLAGVLNRALGRHEGRDESSLITETGTGAAKIEAGRQSQEALKRTPGGVTCVYWRSSESVW